MTLTHFLRMGQLVVWQILPLGSELYIVLLLVNSVTKGCGMNILLILFLELLCQSDTLLICIEHMVFQIELFWSQFASGFQPINIFLQLIEQKSNAALLFYIPHHGDRIKQFKTLRYQIWSMNLSFCLVCGWSVEEYVCGHESHS